MTTILLSRDVQLDYEDNLLETIASLLDIYSLNLRRILSGGLGWSSHTEALFLKVSYNIMTYATRAKTVT